MMKIGTIYTLYGRRAGAELCFEKTMEEMIAQGGEGMQWQIWCNREAAEVLKGLPWAARAEVVPEPMLDRQEKKAFWLEFKARRALQVAGVDVFWNPSGCNHFPGHGWPCPTVTTFHDFGEYHVRAKYDLKRTIFRKWLCIPRSLRRSMRFTCVSGFTARDLQKMFGVRQPVRVVYNGAQPHRLAAVSGADAIVSKLTGWESGRRFFFVPGRTDYRGKGLDLVLDAWTGLRSQLDGMGILFTGPAGEGHERFLRHLSMADAQEGALVYAGRVEEQALSACYQQATGVVLASRFEGFGFPVLEAMEMGTPVLCSDAGALPEVAGDAALIFPAGDVAALQQKMALLAQDQGLRERLRIAGKSRPAAFTWHRCGHEMLEELVAAGVALHKE
jgi:alpha-1,3-rhamnosyl/mannosyltransferase